METIIRNFLIDSQAAKTGQAGERVKGPKAWIREGTEEEPVDFLDPGVVQRVVGKTFPSIQAPVVRRLDNAIQWINLYPEVSAVRL